MSASVFQESIRVGLAIRLRTRYCRLFKNHWR